MAFIRLKKHYKIRKELDGGIVYDSRYEYILSKIHRIPDLHLNLLRLANGQFSIGDLEYLYMTAFEKNVENAHQELGQILNYYEPFLEEVLEQETREDIFVEGNDIVGHDRHYKSFQRLSAPLLVSFVLTYKCHCACKYCFVNASSNHDEHTVLSDEKVFDIIDQVKAMGISTVHITGGEPFLTENIFRILKKCVDIGLITNISTKMILSKQEILNLKQTGIENIQISLDDIDDAINEELIGIKNYCRHMLEMAEMLLNEGIKITVNTVCTSLNINNIVTLAEKLNILGVSKYIINPYMMTLGRHSEALFPTEEQFNKLEEQLNLLAGPMEVSFSKPKLDVFIDKKLSNIPNCTAGRAGIVILPDGKVTICERLKDYKEFIVGDLNYQSLNEIWNSDQLYRIIEPSKELFIGTSCYTCAHFQECVLDRGICYVRSKIVYGRFFEKDPLCPKSKEFIRFF